MTRSRKAAACLVLFLVLLVPAASLASGLPPLAAGTFPVGTIVVPMDGKQADRVHVYGFIHEFLRLVSGAGLARVIEPPDVTMQTALSPSGDLYQGGPFLIEQKFLPDLKNLAAKPIFSKVTYTTLTAAFTSDKIFFVRQPTRILVVYGVFGRTDLTLDRMGINYTLVDMDTVGKNPSILNDYSLIVIDCPGWYGTPNAYHNYNVTSIYNTLRTHVEAGNEVIYTDIALKDLNQTFPGYVNLSPGGAGTWAATFHNPPTGDNFPGEYPSQYYNPPPNPNAVKIFTEGGGWVVSSITPQHKSDVRILMDTDKFGTPYRHAIIGFYFQFGNGIVEGIALHPYEQLYPNYADLNGYYATYEMYGNKFVHGPQLDFLLSASPPQLTISQGQTATYTITVTSLGSFSSTVNLQVTSGLPPGTQANIVPSSVTPSSGGSVEATLTIPTATTTPLGNYNITITGNSNIPLITHSIVVGLTIIPVPTDFSISVSPPRVVINQGSCGNVTVTVKAIGNFSSPVNLTLSGLPAHVTAKFTANPITPPVNSTVVSVLILCLESTAAPGNYTLTVTGSSPPFTHSATVVLSVPKPAGPGPINPLIFLIILAMLLAVLLALLILFLALRRPRRVRMVPVVARMRPLVAQVLPLPTVRCRYCGRIMPITAVYCPFCGRPQVIITRPPVRMVAPGRRLGRNGIIGVVLTIIAGILVLLNSALLLVPSFYAFWSGIFFWLSAIAPAYAFALGVIIGLTLILGAVVMALGNSALADVIIFPFAVFSLIIGGGFIVGFILAFLGGLFGVLRREP